MEKVNYIHNNPVRAGLVERATDYLWSSASWWNKSPREDEPLRVDLRGFLEKRSETLKRECDLAIGKLETCRAPVGQIL